ncbi:hypothetical protein [Mycobacteroides saopaulense]|uniref:Integral membrane protein n=1 Tax=Mycobacteroides saopaulense TaxID=1578165 RepID=A0ABX3BX44_9MYCO|nr:hypothetical protein [Mycobacteroides saopaulense]OHT86477.1 hypothetical protein BKG68_09920 [Mycobacteroides saopaulense]OHU08336.1 hypothetical protein BKG73_14610 [Mycobacteroides saopaulense]
MRNLEEVHEWFLSRGLPVVLDRRVRSRELLDRAAPMIGVAGAGVSLYELVSTDNDTRSIVLMVVLIVLALLLAAQPLVLTALQRLGTVRGDTVRRILSWLVIAIFVIMLPLADTGSWTAAAATMPAFLLAALVLIWLTYLGAGSIGLWALRYASTQFGALGTLMSRALPLLMLTVVVFFTGELWQLSARMTRERLWQTIGFLALTAVAFMAVTVRDELASLRDNRAEQPASAALLAGTPLADLIDGDAPRPALRWPERLNVLLVMVVSQAIQVVFFTTGVFAFFMLLGIVAVPHDVMALWSSEAVCPSGAVPPCAGTWFGIRIGLPQTLIHMALLVAVLSGLYFTVNSSVDPQYRSRFFEPLIADVAVSLAGRDAYLMASRV